MEVICHFIRCQYILFEYDFMTSWFIENRFYACGKFEPGSINQHTSQFVILKLNLGIAITNFLVLEPTLNGNSEVIDMECAFSRSGDRLVQFMITESGHVVTSYIKLDNFDVLEAASGFAFD